MIRIPVNLASEPFRRFRAALVGSVSAIVLLAVPLLMQFASAWAAGWNVTVEPLRSRFGTPGMADAGLFGYLESVAA
ncbi:MAG TPA: hypothetical protein VN610_03600 [Bryobacteraceae bacterium]|nr:hypothetical protein [Bryobacteraceae bacterium]